MTLDAYPTAGKGTRVDSLRCPPTARLASISGDFGRLVILADSLSFHGRTGPRPLDDPRLYPNLLGERLGDLTSRPWLVDVWARAGLGVRDLWVALQKDVHLQQQLLMHADAVVLAIGSVDQASIAVPRRLTMSLPYVRPPRIRRAVRRRIDHAHPTLTRLTGGVFRHTPPDVIRHCWGKSVDAIRLFAGVDVPLVGILPPDHRAVYYGGMRTHHKRVHALYAELALERHVATVDLADLTRDRLDQLNIDGAHWSWPIHSDVAEGFASLLAAQVAQPRAAGWPSPDPQDQT